jgi:ABC-2 type transport system ATP-binding protein
LLQTVAGRVWEWTVPSAELQTVRQVHLVSSTVRTGEGVRLRIVGETAPAADALPVTPTLEDAYLHVIEQRRNGNSS